MKIFQLKLAHKKKSSRVNVSSVRSDMAIVVPNLLCTIVTIMDNSSTLLSRLSQKPKEQSCGAEFVKSTNALVSQRNDLCLRINHMWVFVFFVFGDKDIQGFFFTYKGNNETVNVNVSLSSW